jgi:hypothetical protein
VLDTNDIIEIEERWPDVAEDFADNCREAIETSPPEGHEAIGWREAERLLLEISDVSGLPFTTTVSPTSDGSCAKNCVHARWLMTSTGGASRRSSLFCSSRRIVDLLQ